MFIGRERVKSKGLMEGDDIWPNTSSLRMSKMRHTKRQRIKHLTIILRIGLEKLKRHEGVRWHRDLSEPFGKTKAFTREPRHTQKDRARELESVRGRLLA